MGTDGQANQKRLEAFLERYAQGAEAKGDAARAAEVRSGRTRVRWRNLSRKTQPATPPEQGQP